MIENKALTEFLDTMLTGFEIDPPDSDYQRGYLEAVKLIAREFTNLDQARVGSWPRARMDLVKRT